MAGQIVSVTLRGHAISGDRQGPDGSLPIRFQVLRPLPDGEFQVVSTSDPPFRLPATDGIYRYDLTALRFKLLVKPGDIVSLASRGGKFQVYGQVPGSSINVFSMSGPTQDPGYRFTPTVHPDTELLMQVTEQPDG